jgi:cytochrome o ubiquinol oxidase operon protein cyoD
MDASRTSAPLRGLCLALLLTLTAFALIQFKLFERRTTLLIIALVGTLQLIVHCRYFLGLRLDSKSRDRLLTLAFASVILTVMVASSLWILNDLKMRMMP